MIRLERAGAEDLETIIAIQRASFIRLFMTNTKMNTIPIWRTVNELKWKLVERPNSYYYFVKEKRR